MRQGFQQESDQTTLTIKKSDIIPTEAPQQRPNIKDQRRCTAPLRNIQSRAPNRLKLLLNANSGGGPKSLPQKVCQDLVLQYVLPGSFDVQVRKLCTSNGHCGDENTTRDGDKHHQESQGYIAVQASRLPMFHVCGVPTEMVKCRRWRKQVPAEKAAQRGVASSTSLFLPSCFESNAGSLLRHAHGRT